MRRAPLRALLLVACCATCATPTALERQTATRDALDAFSAALAQAGMSVPLPPRACEEAAGEPRWDDEVGCVDGVGDARASLVVYARALLAERLKDAPAARAEELVAAYLSKDERFVELARAVERDFDARRTASAKPKKPADAPALKKDGTSKDGAKKDGAKKDGADARVAEGTAPPADAGAERGSGVDVDAGALEADAGVVLTVHDRLIGTWVVATDSPVSNVYALCADGRATMHPETSDAALAELLDDMPPAKGSWEVTEGPPPKVAFTWGSDRYEGEITALSSESVTIDYGEETVTATRRSASASCE